VAIRQLLIEGNQVDRFVFDDIQSRVCILSQADIKERAENDFEGIAGPASSSTTRTVGLAWVEL